MGFFTLVRSWQIYRRLEEHVVRTPSRTRRQRLEPVLAKARLRMRRHASKWFLVPPERVHVARLNARGEDIELKRIFTARRPGGRARPRPRATAGSTNEPSREQALSRGGDRPISRPTRRRQ
jgi:hypothetical protein